MSVEAISWALQQQTGDARSKLLLLCLANYADDKGQCWPSQSILAEQTEQSVDTVQRRLDMLEDGGLIKREKRVRDNGSYTTDLVVLTAPFAQPIPHIAVRHTATGGGGYRSTAVGDTALGRYPEPSLNPHLKEREDSPSGGSAKRKEGQGAVVWVDAEDSRFLPAAKRHREVTGQFPIPRGSRHYPGQGFAFPADYPELSPPTGA
jgi:hypothetical protein